MHDPRKHIALWLAVAALGQIAPAAAQTLMDSSVALGVGSAQEAAPVKGKEQAAPEAETNPAQATLPPAELPGTPATPAMAPDIMLRHGSMMFDPHALQLLYDALGGTGNSAVSIADIEGGATINAEGVAVNPKTEQQVIPKPNFSLNSLLFFTPESWSVWINNERIRNNNRETKESLKVLQVHEKGVEFVWQSWDLEQVAPGWKRNFMMTSEARATSNTASVKRNQQEKAEVFKSGAYRWDYKSQDGKILVDSVNDIVKVDLGLHQTFVSSTMKVAEGFVPEPVPVAAEATDKPKGDKPSAAKENPRDAMLHSREKKLMRDDRISGKKDPSSSRGKVNPRNTYAESPAENKEAEAPSASGTDKDEGGKDIDNLVNEVFEN